MSDTIDGMHNMPNQNPYSFRKIFFYNMTNNLPKYLLYIGESSLTRLKTLYQVLVGGQSFLDDPSLTVLIDVI